MTGVRVQRGLPPIGGWRLWQWLLYLGALGVGAVISVLGSIFLVQTVDGCFEPLTSGDIAGVRMWLLGLAGLLTVPWFVAAAVTARIIRMTLGAVICASCPILVLLVNNTDAKWAGCSF